MQSHGKWFALLTLVLTGCAAYVPEPLTTGHPAHPEAAAASERPLSKTLAYTPSDIPSPQPLTSAPTGGPNVQEVDADASQIVMGEGKVIATVTNAGQIIVEHGEIKGFMEAMTMGYTVDPPSLMEDLKFGDKIRFTIHVRKKTIIKIEKMK